MHVWIMRTIFTWDKMALTWWQCTNICSDYYTLNFLNDQKTVISPFQRLTYTILCDALTWIGVKQTISPKKKSILKEIYLLYAYIFYLLQYIHVSIKCCTSCNKGEKQILLEIAENVFLTNFNCEREKCKLWIILYVFTHVHVLKINHIKN